MELRCFLSGNPKNKKYIMGKKNKKIFDFTLSSPMFNKNIKEQKNHN